MTEQNLMLVDARATALAEKQLAKASFANLRLALRPGAIVKRLRHMASDKASGVARHVSTTVQQHPGATASVVAGTGIALFSRPIGAWIASLVRPSGRRSD